MAFSRFTLNTSELDDETVGLDGSPFPLNGIGNAVLSGIDAQASAQVIAVIVAIGSSELGALNAQVSATIEHSASGSFALGAVAGSANATITVAGSASGSLGDISASATAGIDNPATGEASLGGANAQASGGVTHEAEATSSFQTVTASGSALVIVNASGATVIPTIDATAIGTVIPIGEAIADAELGLLDASASASVIKKAGGGGVRWLQQLPPQPKFVAPKDVEEEIVETVVVRDPVLVSGFASVVLGSVRSRAVGGVSWIAEKDDEELLMMV
jgi:hypothetical protein